jgi:hypothetical protein
MQPPIDLNTYWGKVGMYIWKGSVVHVAIITKYITFAMTCNIGHQAICRHLFASHGGPNMTLGEFTPSYILHTRAFGTYLPCKKDYKVMVFYM